jgi:catalase
MALDGNGDQLPTTSRTALTISRLTRITRKPAMSLESDVADTWDRNKNDNDHYSQAGALFRKVMTDQERANTVGNFVGALKGVSGPKKKEILMRQLDHFHKADKELAQLVAKGLGIKYPRQNNTIK